MIEQQENHWWFKARRKIIHTILKKKISSKNTTILEIGCGTGSNLLMLREFGHVSAMEMDKFALDHASKITGIDVKTGWLPDNIPFQGKFDLICMFDVLEHIKDDTLALIKTRKMLNPNGILILTVPSHSWLYGTHDKIHHHYRRYSTKALKKILNISKIKILKTSHLNFFLFPALVLARIADAFYEQKKTIGYKTPRKLLNTLLYKIFVFERYLIAKINVPFGGSVIVLAKPYNPSDG